MLLDYLLCYKEKVWVFVDCSHGPRCIFQPKCGNGSHATVLAFLVIVTEGGKRHYWRKKQFNQRPEISEYQTKVRIRSSALGRMYQGGKEGAEPSHQHTVTVMTHDGSRSRDSCFLPITLSLILCVNNTWRQKLWSLVWSSSDANDHSHPAQLVIQKFVSIMEKKQRKEMRQQIQ